MNNNMIRLVLLYILLSTTTGVYSNKFEAPDFVKNESYKRFNNGNYHDTINYCLGVLNTYPEDHFVMLYLAYAYMRVGKLVKAERTYLSILKNDNKNQKAYNGLKELYESEVYKYIYSGNINKAFTVLQKAQKMQPEESLFFQLDGELNSRIGNYRNSISLFYKALDLVESNRNSDQYLMFRILKSSFDVVKNLEKQMMSNFKNILISYSKRFDKNKDILTLLADVYYYNDEKLYDRIKLRNKAYNIYTKETVNRQNFHIEFPLRGQWKVSSGPFDYLVDTHNGLAGHCLDFIKENSSGRLSSGNGSNNQDYLSYGEEIYSVADGVVESVSDLINDNPIGIPNFNSTNFIQIRHVVDGEVYYSLYVHILKNSARYKVGESVKSGEVIANVGNSGLSYAPHLHFGLLDRNKVSLPVLFKNITVNDNFFLIKEKEVCKGDFCHY